MEFYINLILPFIIILFIEKKLFTLNKSPYLRWMILNPDQQNFFVKKFPQQEPSIDHALTYHFLAIFKSSDSNTICEPDQEPSKHITNYCPTSLFTMTFAGLGIDGENMEESGNSTARANTCQYIFIFFSNIYFADLLCSKT